MPDPAFVQGLRELLGIDLQEVAGTSISGEIPLRHDLVNRLIAQRLAGSDGPISAAHLEALDDDTFSAQLSFRGPKFLPVVGIVARIEQQPRSGPEGPPLHKGGAVLVLRWSIPGVGRLGLLAAPALTFLQALPPGIRAEGDRIDVDIGAVLRSRGLDWLLEYIVALQVHTRRGAFLVRFELRVS